MQVGFPTLEALVFVFVQLRLSLAESFSQVLYGELFAGNYTYYTLSKTGSVLLILRTLQGDADLYVSSKTKKPTFFLDSHEFQATSCGIDQIHISELIPRPLGIAVYGHPRSTFTEYALQVLLNETPMGEENIPGPEAEQSPDSDDGKPEIPDSVMHFLEIIGSILSFVLQILLEVLS